MGRCRAGVLIDQAGKKMDNRRTANGIHEGYSYAQAATVVTSPP